MKSEKTLTFIGLGLLVVCFTISLTRVFSRSHPELNKDGTNKTVTIRFAHWQLESGIRGALDALATDYEREHPGVKVEQIVIPDRIYPSWSRTQLIGETAPDLLQIGMGINDEMIARFFVPLSTPMQMPNPANKGNDLEKLRWRDTFVDGLAGGSSYRANLLEFYAAPVSMFTVRMYYNKTLWRALLGDTPLPEDYDAFIAICERVHARAVETGDKIIPVAGSRYNAPMLISRLFSSQTQRLALDINDSLSLRPSGPEIGLAYLDGRWSIDDPAIARGMELSRDSGRFFQPGFMQLGRDDASFYFLQGRALMIATGSWDAPSFRSQASFEIGAFTMPLPKPGHPLYGAGILGAPSEGDTPAGVGFGITRGSPHPELALDFLRFITSQKNNQKFARISGWLPSVAGVQPSADLVPFLPIMDGYPDGFDLMLKALGADSSRLIDTNQNLLLNPRTDISVFKDVIRSGLPGAIRSDLERIAKSSLQNTIRQDTLLGTQLALSGHSLPPEEIANLNRKIAELTEAQTQQELERAWTLLQLERTAKKGPTN